MSYTRVLIQRSPKNWRSFSPPTHTTSLLSTTRQLFPPSSARGNARPFSAAVCGWSPVFNDVPDELSPGDTGVAPTTSRHRLDTRPRLTRSRSFSDFSSRSGPFPPPEEDGGESQSPHRLYAPQPPSMAKVTTPFVRPPSAPPSSHGVTHSKNPFANDGRGLELINRYARVPNVFTMMGNFSSGMPPPASGRRQAAPQEKQPPPSAHQDSSPDHHAHALHLEEKEPIGAYAGDAAAAATMKGAATRRPRNTAGHEASTFPVPPAPPIPSSAAPPTHAQPSSSQKSSRQLPQTAKPKVSSFSSTTQLSRIPYPWQKVASEPEQKEHVEEVSSGWSLTSMIRHMRGYLHRKRSREDSEPPQNDALFTQVSSTKIRRKEKKSSVYDVATSAVADSKSSHSETTQPSPKMEVETDAMYSTWEDPLQKIQEQLLRQRPADEHPRSVRFREMPRDVRRQGVYGMAHGGVGGGQASYSNSQLHVAPTPPPPPPPPSPPPPPPAPHSPQFPLTGFSSPRSHYDIRSHSIRPSEGPSHEESAYMTGLTPAQRDYVGTSVPLAETKTNFGAVTRHGDSVSHARERQSMSMRCSMALRSTGVTGRMRTLRRERKCLGHGGAPRTDLLTFFSMAAMRPDLDTLGPGADVSSTVAAGYSLPGKEEKASFSPYAAYAIRSVTQPSYKSKKISGKGDYGFGWGTGASADPSSHRPRATTAILSAPDVSVEMGGGAGFAYSKAETYAFAQSSRDGRSVFAATTTTASTSASFTRPRSMSASDGRAALVAFAERLSRASVAAGSDPANPCSYPQSSQWNQMEAGRVI